MVKALRYWVEDSAKSSASINKGRRDVYALKAAKTGHLHKRHLLHIIRQLFHEDTGASQPE